MSVELLKPSNHLILCHPLILLPSIFPSIRVFSNESVLSSGGQSIGVSASVFVLPMKFRTDFLQNWLTVSPCSSRDSRVFSNIIVQAIAILVLSFLYNPTLISIYDYWKNHNSKLILKKKYQWLSGSVFKVEGNVKNVWLTRGHWPLHKDRLQ